MCADRLKTVIIPGRIISCRRRIHHFGKEKLAGVNKGYLVQNGGKQSRQPGSKERRGGGGREKVGGVFEKLQCN